jgi:hypothetical protein
MNQQPPIMPSGTNPESRITSHAASAPPPTNHESRITNYQAHDPDEINLLEYVYVLVHNKWWIIGATVLGMVIGLVAAYVKGPTYMSQIVIAPKETDSQKNASFAGLGALGGLVASQLSLAGNASLDKIDMVLTTKKFNAEMIEADNLLPAIYKAAWPKAYKKFYDGIGKRWRPEFKQPKLADVGALISGKYLKKITNKNNTMAISVSTRDSTLSHVLMISYTEYLNKYLKETIQENAQSNVAYLDSQLIRISDPLLREKVQGLIASELEKAMVVSKEAFQVVDNQYEHRIFKELKLFPLGIGAALFIIATAIVIFGHAFKASSKSAEDLDIIKRIADELVLHK